MESLESQTAALQNALSGLSNYKLTLSVLTRLEGLGGLTQSLWTREVPLEADLSVLSINWISCSPPPWLSQHNGR